MGAEAYSALAALREEPRRRLLHYAAADGRPYVRHRWQVDFYIVESTNPQRHEYFRMLFSNSPDQANPNGVPFITL